MSATDSSSSANAENNANFDHAGSSARTLEAIPSRTPSVSEADVEVNTVGEAAANLSILEAGCEGIEHERISIQVVTKWESDFVLYAHSNERTVDYAVTRDVLRVTSPVLRQLIEQNSEQYPTHSDENGGCCDICGRRKGHSTLHLEEDDLEAFLSLLEIVHSRASHHLLDPDFDLVTRIAVACEKYGWQKAILPWKQIWIKKYLKHILEPGYEDWLRVAKIFEIEEKTTGLVDLLCEECSCLVRDAESGRNFVKRKGKPVFTDLWPQEILEEILESRDIVIIRLMGSLWTLMEVLQSTENSCESEFCMSLAYGSLLRSMERVGISRTMCACGEDRSVVDLWESLTKIKIYTYRRVSSHHKCRINSLREQFESYIKKGDFSDSITWDMTAIS